MFARRVIQDSDDEDGISPEKPAYSPITEGTIESLTRPGSSQQHAGNGDAVQELNGNLDSTGSTELLSKAIHDAHHNLIETSPESIELIPHGAIKSGITLHSPTVEKVQRKKTTMEAYSSSKSSGRGMRDNVFVDSEGLGQELKRRKTTTDTESSIWEYPDSPVPSGLPQHGAFADPPIGPDYSPETTIANISTDAGPNSTDRRPPEQSSSSARMTTPTIPTRSSRGKSHQSVGPSMGGLRDRESTEEYDTARNTETSPTCLHVSSQEASKVGTTAQVIIKTKITQGTTGDKDELSLSCSSEDDVRSILPLKKKLSNKRVRDEHVDELGLDDLAGDIPQEHYKPRPSRSRAIISQSLDDMVLAIDYSKRPEAVARKAKRRKTTETTVEEEDVSGGGSTKKLGKTCEIWEVSSDEDGLSKEDFKGVTSKVDERRGRTKKVVNSDDEDDCIHVAPKKHPTTEESAPVISAVTSKKTRMRRKTEETDLKDMLISAGEDELVDDPGYEKSTMPKEVENARQHHDPISGLSETPAATPPISHPKKERKRKVRRENLAISEDRIGTESEVLPRDTITSTMRAHTPPLTENNSAANVIKPSNPETPAPTETPQKAAAKGPTKHSPLNSGKIKYRVGLSKNARIAPLLKFVRKDS